MLFNSLEFFLFFPIVSLVYFLIPHKVRYIWLLFASFFFYMQWNAAYALLMLTSITITYFSGYFIEKFDTRNQEKLKKICVAVSFVSNIAILFFFKYFDFMLHNLNMTLGLVGVSPLNPNFDVLLPVGISFYTFQALGYTVDVYRKDVKHERNFLRYALFVSFFPQLVAGPIERSSNLIHQLREKHEFDARRVVRGLSLMLWGYFLKLVVADRAALLVNTVYNNPTDAANKGFVVAIATILFAFQIYCDFASYSEIARGCAEVMGIRLMKNFDTPYFSKSIGEFWRRWHISLSSWFRDYLYIPLGGNRKGRTRKNINLLIVFFVSGLWHGASWNFVIWGMLNGIYQVIGDYTKTLRKKIGTIFEKRENFSGKLLSVITTFLLVCFSWIFFRANGTHDGFLLVKNLFSEFNPWIFTDGTLFNLGLDSADMFVLAVALLVLLLVSVAKYKNMQLRLWLEKQDLWFRYAIYLIALFSVLIFGIYGVNYDAASFIYFQF